MMQHKYHDDTSEIAEYDESISYVPPHRFTLFFLRDYPPTIYVKYGLHGSPNIGKFVIDYPTFRQYAYDSYRIVAHRDDIERVMDRATRGVQDIEGNLAYYLGYPGMEAARDANHVQDLVSWFDMKEYMWYFSVQEFYDQSSWERDILQPIRDSRMDRQDLLRYVQKVFTEQVHTSLVQEFDEHTLRATPVPWLASAIHEPVRAQVQVELSQHIARLQKDYRLDF